MKQIDYKPKVTGANTQYNELAATDMIWVQTQLLRYMSMMGELKNNRNPAVRAIVKEYWSKKTDTLPRGRNGRNSPETYISGLINNLIFGNQRDLSDTQMQALTNIAHVVSEIADATKKLNLQSNCDPLEPFMFKEKLFDFDH